ncbi:hypothetical protein BGY98DRAFT_111646 [Russula aff. rugulosa BPL654]|nr:hypothetical protein BGY98DRAFT_111646 [Russula aff. rugulosa BPL654]
MPTTSPCPRWQTSACASITEYYSTRRANPMHGVRMTASSFEQVCTSSLASRFHAGRSLHLRGSSKPTKCQDDVEITLWLPVEILPPFAPVKNLSPCKEFVPPYCARLARTCRENNDRRSSAHLGEYFLRGLSAESFHEGIEKFVAARRLTSHPVAVSRWHRERNRESIL